MAECWMKRISSIKWSPSYFLRREYLNVLSLHPARYTDEYPIRGPSAPHGFTLVQCAFTLSARSASVLQILVALRGQWNRHGAVYPEPATGPMENSSERAHVPMGWCRVTDGSSVQVSVDGRGVAVRWDGGVRDRRYWPGLIRCPISSRNGLINHNHGKHMWVPRVVSGMSYCVGCLSMYKMNIADAGWQAIQ